jgi:hypothetical protein
LTAALAVSPWGCDLGCPRPFLKPPISLDRNSPVEQHSSITSERESDTQQALGRLTASWSVDRALGCGNNNNNIIIININNNN